VRKPERSSSSQHKRPCQIRGGVFINEYEKGQEESEKYERSQWVDLEVGDDYREVPVENGTSKSEQGKEKGQDKRRFEDGLLKCGQQDI
jgi:hypothetical protein